MPNSMKTGFWTAMLLLLGALWFLDVVEWQLRARGYSALVIAAIKLLLFALAGGFAFRSGRQRSAPFMPVVVALSASVGFSVFRHASGLFPARHGGPVATADHIVLSTVGAAAFACIGAGVAYAEHRKRACRAVIPAR